MKPKKPTQKKKKNTISRDPLSIHLQTLDQILKNTNASSDKECKDAVWSWLSNHDMYSFYCNESRNKPADQIFNEVFMQVSAFCIKKGLCKKRPLTINKFEQEWKKAIRKYEKESNKPAYMIEL